MPVNKPHLEFHRVDMGSGWQTPEGYPAGIEQKILAGSLDETGKTGSRTRLLRFQPGIYTSAPFVHDYWEEVFLVEGASPSATTPKATAARTFALAPMPAARPALCMGRSSRMAAACCWRAITTRTEAPA
jgi:hypothetical protein